MRACRNVGLCRVFQETFLYRYIGNSSGEPYTTLHHTLFRHHPKYPPGTVRLIQAAVVLNSPAARTRVGDQLCRLSRLAELEAIVERHPLNLLSPIGIQSASVTDGLRSRGKPNGDTTLSAEEQRVRERLLEMLEPAAERITGAASFEQAIQMAGQVPVALVVAQSRNVEGGALPGAIGERQAPTRRKRAMGWLQRGGRRQREGPRMAEAVLRAVVPAGPAEAHLLLAGSLEKEMRHPVREGILGKREAGGAPAAEKAVVTEERMPKIR